VSWEAKPLPDDDPPSPDELAFRELRLNRRRWAEWVRETVKKWEERNPDKVRKVESK
jgi:hypothetical protein